MLNNYIDKIIIKTSKQISDLQLVLNLQRLDDISVASGISSVCILFAELDYTFPNRGWDRIGHEYLIHIKKIRRNGRLFTVMSRRHGRDRFLYISFVEKWK